MRELQDRIMKILFYRYGNICEPDIIEAFQKMNIEVTEERTEMTIKTLSPSKQIDLLQKQIDACAPGDPFLFLFSVNYFPAIAEFCHVMQIPYVCWTVDSPVLELFSNSIRYDTNFIFLFDYAQYMYFHPQNPNHIFYLPLATNVHRWDRVLSMQKEGSSAKSCPFSSLQEDISFVGSLYTEKCKYNNLMLSSYTEGFLSGLMEAQLRLFGDNIVERSLPLEIVEEIKQADPHFFFSGNTFTNPDAYVVAHDYLGYKLAETERIRTLNLLAERFQVSLYTRSDTSSLKGVTLKGGVQTLTEMPFVFSNSKINLNITLRAIQTGLSLRVYDIMGCGGFLMTNYQAELPEYFEIGKDLEAYGSPEELIDKCTFYLNHPEDRTAIAKRGYEKVKCYHTYDSRINSMIVELGKHLS